LCRPDREPRDIAFYSAVSPARRAPTLTESQERGAKRRRMAALFLFLNLLISPFNPARWLEAEDTVLRHLSFPKIRSEHTGDAAQPEWAQPRPCPIVGWAVVAGYLCPTSDEYAFDCNRRHRQKEFVAGGTGRLRVPPRAHTRFLPQRFHTAPGSLRDLGHSIPSLEHKVRWDKELTADELLHLHFARLLVHKPQWVVSDEAICHLNEDDRKIMFSLFENELSKAAVISITSIDAQHTFYSRILHLIARPARRTPTPPSTSALLASSGAERT
jgi:hypothetical protein